MFDKSSSRAPTIVGSGRVKSIPSPQKPIADYHVSHCCLYAACLYLRRDQFLNRGHLLSPSRPMSHNRSAVSLNWLRTAFSYSNNRSRRLHLNQGVRVAMHELPFPLFDAVQSEGSKGTYRLRPTSAYEVRLELLCIATTFALRSRPDRLRR
jgi:hypothetical protein